MPAPSGNDRVGLWIERVSAPQRPPAADLDAPPEWNAVGQSNAAPSSFANTPCRLAAREVGSPAGNSKLPPAHTDPNSDRGAAAIPLVPYSQANRPRTYSRATCPPRSSWQR